MFYVYILYSRRLDKYYVGSTNDIERRLKDHNRGKTPYSKTGMPWDLLVAETYPTREEAVKRERNIKRQKSRRFIERVIRSAGSEHPDYIGRVQRFEPRPKAELVSRRRTIRHRPPYDRLQNNFVSASGFFISCPHVLRYFLCDTHLTYIMSISQGVLSGCEISKTESAIIVLMHDSPRKP